jgi:hypothetical protein
LGMSVSHPLPPFPLSLALFSRVLSHACFSFFRLFCFILAM